MSGKHARYKKQLRKMTRRDVCSRYKSLQHCVYDSTKLICITGKELNPDNPKIATRKFMQCPKCKARVRCHENGGPMGYVANPELQRLRREAHKSFDPIWKSEKVNRDAAYRKMAVRLNIGYGDCHIAKLNIIDIRKFIIYADEYRQFLGI